MGHDTRSVREEEPTTPTAVSTATATTTVCTTASVSAAAAVRCPPAVRSRAPTVRPRRGVAVRACPSHRSGGRNVVAFRTQSGRPCVHWRHVVRVEAGRWGGTQDDPGHAGDEQSVTHCPRDVVILTVVGARLRSAALDNTLAVALAVVVCGVHLVHVLLHAENDHKRFQLWLTTVRQHVWGLLLFNFVDLWI